MLPRAHRRGVPDRHRLAGGEGLDEVDDQRVGGEVPAADHVARAAAGDLDPVLGDPVAREKGVSPRADHQLGGSLAPAVGAQVPERVPLAVAPRLLDVAVALVAGDDHHGARLPARSHGVEQARRADHVDLERLARDAIALADHRLGGEVEHHVRIGGGEGGGERLPVADVGPVVGGEAVGDGGDLEMGGVGRGVERVAGDPRAEALEPQTQPRSLEAGVPGHEDRSAGERLGEAAHAAAPGRATYGRVPSAKGTIDGMKSSGTVRREGRTESLGRLQLSCPLARGGPQDSRPVHRRSRSPSQALASGRVVSPSAATSE